MDPSFWHARWEAGRIGFHHDAVNPYLVDHLPCLELRAGARVLVPLCGKSVDLGWLADRGLEPVGVELSRLAVDAVFAERGVRPRRETRADGAERFVGGGVEVWCGDFLALDARHGGRFDALWDRAALIALPAAWRPGYVEQCAALMRPGARGLVVTLRYDPAEMDGPPFAVAPEDVEALYAPHFDVEVASPERPGKVAPHLQERGLTRLDEAAWRITRKP